MGAASDDTLLASFALGDPDAAAAFIRRFQGRVYGLARSMVADPHQLREALDHLPGEQRQALLHAALCGRTAQEITDSEGIPLGTAKTRIRTGLMKVRASMSTRGSDS